MNKILYPKSHYWVLLSIVLVAIVTTSCVPVPMPGPYIDVVDDRSTTSPALLKSDNQLINDNQPINNLAIAGVTSTLSPLSYEQRSTLSDELLAALRSERPSITFLTHYDIETLIGSGLHQQILDQYQSSGDLLETHWAPLQRVGADFVVLVKLERDSLRYTNGEPEIGDSLTTDNQYRKITASVLLNTERSIAVTFAIYDVNSQKLVWQSSADATRTRSNSYQYSYTGSEADSIDLAGKLQTDLAANNRTIYPEPETLNTLMKRIFANFARQLPETS